MRLLALHKRIVDVFEIFIRMLLASYVNRQKRAEQSRADSSRVLERERERDVHSVDGGERRSRGLTNFVSRRK